LNKYILLIAMALGTAIAVAATNGSEHTNSTEAASVKLGNVLTMPETAAPPTHPVSIAADAKQSQIGKVIEVIESPMYTYLKVTGDKGPLWLAAYKTDITKGSTVKYSGKVTMPNFYSKALNRTFEVIVFVDSLELVME
jgi:hypothetical protein